MNGCPLTSRQLEVLRLVASGLTYKQTGLELGIRHSTVKSHLEAAYRRLGVHNVGQAAALLIREQWVSPDELLPDYTGPGYSTRRMRKDDGWLPTPAQRLYLDAFDRLLTNRSEDAAAEVAFYMAVMCQERGIPVRRRGGHPDIGDMLATIAVCVMRPLPRIA